MSISQDHAATLRRLSINDERLLERALSGRACDAACRLDDRMVALVRFAALVASNGPPVAYASVVSSALSAGVTPDELVDVLVGVTPIVGSVAAVSAAPKLALAVDYDLETDLEELGPSEF